VYDWVSREVLYKILIQVKLSAKLIRLIEICYEAYCKVCIGKRSSDKIGTENCLQQGGALLPHVLKFVLDHVIKNVQENFWGWNVTGHISCWLC
jgi:hypothetical protein